MESKLLFSFRISAGQRLVEKLQLCQELGRGFQYVEKRWLRRLRADRGASDRSNGDASRFDDGRLHLGEPFFFAVLVPDTTGSGELVLLVGNVRFEFLGSAGGGQHGAADTGAYPLPHLAHPTREVQPLGLEAGHAEEIVGFIALRHMHVDVALDGNP